jgi:hypothetical protein
MYTYIYSYKSDSTNEVIGKVSADDLTAAVKIISQKKQLSEHTVTELFNIERERV